MCRQSPRRHRCAWPPPPFAQGGLLKLEGVFSMPCPFAQGGLMKLEGVFSMPCPFAQGRLMKKVEACAAPLLCRGCLGLVGGDLD